MNYARNVFGKVEKLIQSQMYEEYEYFVGLMQMLEIILMCAFISFLRVGRDIESLLFECLIFSRLSLKLTDIFMHDAERITMVLSFCI